MEQKISGFIYAQRDDLEKCGYSYMIRPKNGMGWSIPTRDITPDDLRKLADHYEKAISDKK